MVELPYGRYLFHKGQRPEAYRVILDALVEEPRTFDELLDLVNDRVDRPKTDAPFSDKFLRARLEYLKELNIVTYEEAGLQRLWLLTTWPQFREGTWKPLRRDLKRKLFEEANREIPEKYIEDDEEGEA